MTRIGYAVAVLAWIPFLAAPGQVRTAAAKPPGARDVQAKLPVKRVALYKNGIGYFEHVGAVRDNQEVAIAFTPGQLNDVLKSLTVLDLNGGRIAGVTYDSAAPAARQVADLQLQPGNTTTLSGFLAGLRGARLEVRGGNQVITGRLLSVEHMNRTAGDTTVEVAYVSLVTDDGELRTTELSPSFSVRLLEPELAGKVSRFLNVLASERETDTRRLVVSTAGSGLRSLFVSYLSETPVWKTTYRIVLPSGQGQKPLLQGWAIVDNTIGQDWENVELSLVAGAPHSFIQEISRPYFARRPTVPLAEGVVAAPQTHESTLVAGRARLSGTVTDPSGVVVAGASVTVHDAAGNHVDETSTNAFGKYEFANLPQGNLRLFVEMAGFRPAVLPNIPVSGTASLQRDVRLEVGQVAEAIEISASTPTPQTSASVGRSRTVGSGKALGSGLALGRSGVPGFGPGTARGAGSGTFGVLARSSGAEAAASTKDLGDLFEYKLKEPITVRKNQSALVPIVQSPITCEKVSIWNERVGVPRPQRALWLTNSSGLTLDGGSFSVLESDAFAGEGMLNSIRPGEKRLVSYATDLAITAGGSQTSEQQRVARVRISRGMMTHYREVREKILYTFRNEDSSSRTLIVEHPVRPGYKLTGEARPVETSAGWMRFRLNVEPKQSASLVVEESRPLEASYTISKINHDQVAVFVREQSIEKTVEETLRRVLEKKQAVDGIEEQKGEREGEVEALFDDQQRLRENIKALKGSVEEKALLQRYVRQLNEQETRLDELRKQVTELKGRHEVASAELDRMIEAISLDVSLSQ